MVLEPKRTSSFAIMLLRDDIESQRDGRWDAFGPAESDQVVQRLPREGRRLNRALVGRPLGRGFSVIIR